MVSARKFHKIVSQVRFQQNVCHKKLHLFSLCTLEDFADHTLGEVNFLNIPRQSHFVKVYNIVNHFW